MSDKKRLTKEGMDNTFHMILSGVLMGGYMLGDMGEDINTRAVDMAKLELSKMFEEYANQRAVEVLEEIQDTNVTKTTYSNFWLIIEDKIKQLNK